MELQPNDTQTLIRDTARAFARDRLAPNARMLDREERFPTEALREMAGLGLMGINIPEELGGSGAGVVSYAVAVMELAAACASTTVAMCVTNMCAELIYQFGSEAQRQRFVPLITSGEAVAGAFALSEPHSGSDASALRTTAKRVGDRWVLNGAKQWITSGSHAGVMVVWARTADTGAKGISCFIVERGTPGLTAGRHEEKMGLRGSNTVPLTFENCEIPADHLLGNEGDGFKLAMTALDGGRVGIASQACGVGRAALDASLKYMKERQAFGQPISEFQALRWFVADMQTQLSAAELLTLRAAWMKENKLPFTREASMAKVFASEMSNRACDKAVQVHGGYGYIDEFPVERLMRDARVQTIYEGTSEIQRLVIARDLYRAHDARG